MSRYDDIITALRTRFALVLKANGYRTDAGLKVWLNLEYQTAPPAKPCVIIYPGDVSDSLDGNVPPSLGEENHALPIKLEGFIDDTETGAQGQSLRQDILQAFNTDRSLGNLVELVDPGLSSSATVEEGGEAGFISFVQVELTLNYVTLMGES